MVPNNQFTAFKNVSDSIPLAWGTEGQMWDYHSVLVTYFITGFSNPLRSVLLPANLSSSHILSLTVTLSVPLKPSSPSLSILPFLSHSSHSVPLFDEKPVKVAPAAVQTQMDPRSVCAQKEPPHPNHGRFCACHYHSLTSSILSPWHQGMKEPEKKDDDWGEVEYVLKWEERRAIGREELQDERTQEMMKGGCSA